MDEDEMLAQINHIAATLAHDHEWFEVTGPGGRPWLICFACTGRFEVPEVPDHPPSD